MSFRNQSHIMLGVLTALGLAVSVACGSAANHPPMATVAPPDLVAQAPVVTPTATVAPAAAVAPAHAPAAGFVMPTPRPTRTPMPRTEGDMTQPILYGHTATLLEDGRVLVTGGGTGVFHIFGFAGVVSAEIYDPSTGRWSPTGPMFEPHVNHAAVLFGSGSVLVSGGLDDEWEVGGADARLIWLGSISSAELYDPSTETWSLVGDMPEETSLHLLEMLENGKVLATGGLGASAALYDPASGTWASVGEATSRNSETRLWEANAVVTDGKVLFMGGWDNSGPMDSAELWDPLTDSSSPTSRMNTPRAASTATVLADGRVLVTGGYGNDRFGLVASAEIYDPSSGTWSGAGEMTTKRMGHTMTVLSDGRVLVVGGGNKATETYDPSTGSWSRAARMIEHRRTHTATLLKDGRVLVAGGASGTSGQPYPSTSAEVYDPATDTWSASTDAAR